MKLLSKSAINTASALERSIEISEGKKLAGKIDELRRLRADEESNWIKFRDESVAKVKADIIEILNTKSALETEVSWLEDCKREAQKPIDEKEEAFARREQEMTDRENEVKKQLADFAEHKVTVDLKWREYNNEKESIATEKAANESLLKEVLELQKKARKEKRDAEALYLNATERSNQIAEALLNRELDVATRERDVTNRSQHLDDLQDALNLRERGIIDREETLGRELKRIIQ